MAEHGFDITDFGFGGWERLCKETGLKYNGIAISGHCGVVCWEWINRRGLKVFTQNDPLTGKYLPEGHRPDQKGFASYIGASGPDYEVSEFASAVRRHAAYIKDETIGVRTYI